MAKSEEKKYKSRKKKVKCYHVSENNTSLNVSVDDFNDVTDITPLSPTPESDNDGTTSTDSSDSSYAVVAASPQTASSQTASSQTASSVTLTVQQVILLVFCQRTFSVSIQLFQQLKSLDF